jgi:streptogramin lyase
VEAVIGLLPGMVPPGCRGAASPGRVDTAFRGGWDVAATEGRRFGVPMQSLSGIVLSLAWLAVGCSGGSSHATEGSQSSVLARPSAAHVVKRTVRVGAGPYEVAAGLGALWVSETSGIVKFDPNTGTVVAHAAIRNDGEWTGVGVGGGSVWYLESPGTLAQVDPNRTSVERVVAFGKDNGTEAYEYVGVSPWGVCTSRIAPTSEDGLVCLGAGSNTSVFNVRAGSGPVVGTDDGSIWVGGKSLTRLTPSTRAVETIPLPHGSAAAALASDGRTVWVAVNVANTNPQLWRIEGDRVQARLVVRRPPVSAVAVGAGGLWILSSGTIGYLQPNGTLTQIASVPKDSRGLAATANAVWTVQYHVGTATFVSGFR